MSQLLVGKYEILECLGTGGSGNVHRAIQYPLERVVALKLLRPELGRNAAVRRRFAREARAVASLNHANITTVFDFGATPDGTLYLAMEFVDGSNLRQLIRDGLPTVPTVLLAEQILSGLAHAHARGIVHRDLKPANVLVPLIDGQLNAKIVDFGIAAVAGGDETDRESRGKVVGTPAYMSPEQARGERNLTPATDIYNLGLILYEAAAGRQPFIAATPQAMMLQHCTAPVPRPLPRPGFLLPQGLEAVILRCLEKSPGDRYASAAECRAAVAIVRKSLEDRGHSLYLPVAPMTSADTAGRITLVEGSARVVASEPLALAGAIDVPFVGRAEERRFLLELCQRVIERQRGAVVVLEGETGSGKTRLATWLSEHLVERGEMRSITGSYHREGGGGLHGLREVVDSLFGTRGLETPATSARVVSQLLSWGLTDARAAGTLIEMIRPPEGDDGGERQSDHKSLFGTLLRVFEVAARQSPLLVILDDLQWCGPQTVDFVSLLVSELKNRDAPVVFLFTVRSDDVARNEQLANQITSLAVYEHEVMFRRRLGRMTDDEIRALVQQVLPAHDSLSEMLVRRSDGNPLFALQVLRFLIDEERVALTDTGHYAAVAGANVDEIVPPSLADLLQLRLIQLERQFGPDRPLIPVLERAAVLGSRFPFDALAHMVREDPDLESVDLDSLIDGLLDEGLLVQAPNTQEDVLDFNHTLVRDVLLKRMAPRRGTRKLHVAAAEAKRAYFVGREDLIAPQLAAHFELGRRFDDAVRYAHLAAVTAERMHRPADAVISWRRYLRLHDRADELVLAELELPPVDEVTVRLGELEEALGWYDAASDTLRRVLPDNARPSTLLAARAAVGLGTIALKQGRALEAEGRFKAGRATAEELGDGGLRARAGLGMARVSWHFGDREVAEQEGSVSLEFARRAGEPALQADALWFLGDVARLTGRQGDAQSRFEQAKALFDHAQDPRGSARCLFGLALLARSRDDLDVAESLYHEVYDTLEPLGSLRGLGHCLNGLGEVARFRKRLVQAREYYQRAVELFHTAGLANDAAVSLTNLGMVARDAGDLDTAREAMERALSVAEATNYRYLTLGIAFNLAWVYALLNQHERAERMIEAHIERARQGGLVDPDYARPLEAVAQILEQAGDRETARKLYKHAQGMWEELSRKRDASRVAKLLR